MPGLNVVSFLCVVFHAVMFFKAAPQALVVHIGRTRVPGRLVMAAHYVAWALASVLIALADRGCVGDQTTSGTCDVEITIEASTIQGLNWAAHQRPSST